MLDVEVARVTFPNGDVVETPIVRDPDGWHFEIDTGHHSGAVAWEVIHTEF